VLSHQCFFSKEGRCEGEVEEVAMVANDYSTINSFYSLYLSISRSTTFMCPS